MGALKAILAPHKKVLMVLFCVVLILVGLVYAFIAPSSPFSGLHGDLKAINPAEEVSYTDLDGAVVSLESFKGKPLIINAWATWMPFSKDELVLLTALKSEYGDRVNFLAINRMEDREFIKSYLTTFSIPQELIFLVDPADSFYKAIEGFAMPETVIYDREGVKVLHIHGVATEAEIRATLSAYLE